MDLNHAKEEIRNRIDIVDYIGQFVKLERRSNVYFGLCPFHSEKTPSFCVNPNNQTWYCFGQCRKGGDIFKFVEEYNNMNFFESVKYLAEKLDITIDSGYNSKDNEEKKQLYELYKNVANEYYRILFSENGKAGLEYIKKRKLNRDTVKKFGLGFSPNEYGHSHIYNLLKSKSVPENILKLSELFTYKEDGKIYDKFYSRVMFPIQDIYGKVIAFGGRRIDDIKDNKYINSKNTMIFKKSDVLYAMHIAKMSKKDYFLLCEGNIDVITLHQAGFDNAIAMLGVGINDTHIKQMLRFKKKVILCLDTDKTGVETTIKAIEMINRWGIDVKVLNINAVVGGKKIKDVDEFINEPTLGVVEFEKRVDTAIDSFLFIISQIKYKYRLSDTQEYARYIEEVINRLLTIEEKLVRDKYIELVAKQENLNETDLKNSIASKIKNDKKDNKDTKENVKIENSYTKNAEENASQDKLSSTIVDFINILLMHTELVPSVTKYVQIDDIYNPNMKELYKMLIDGMNYHDIVEKYSNSDTDESKEMLKYLFNVDNKIDYSKAVEHLKALIKRIRERLLRDELENLKKSDDLDSLTRINKIMIDLKNIKTDEIEINV